MIANKAFWDGLAPDVRAALEKAMAEATEYANSIAQQENDDALAAMKAAGKTTFYELSPKERQAWIKALLPVHKEMASRIGADLVARTQKETGLVD